MKKTKTPFFRKLQYAITKPKAYQQMATEGFGRAILYLLLFTLTFGLLSALIQSYSFTKTIDGFINQIETDLPDFSLENGLLEVEGNEPIVFEEDNTLIYIDDSEAADVSMIESELENYDSAIIILRDRFINKQNRIRTEELYFSEISEFSLDKDTVLNFLPLIKWLSVLIGLAIIIWFFVSKLIMGFLVGLLGLILAAIFKRKIAYGYLYAIGLYAITTPTLLDLIADTVGGNLPWYVFYLLTAVYLGLAIKEWNNTEGEVIQEEVQSQKA
ncbi:DUF1189 domain-containing protein [Bacillus sp. 2205SS5-2]|uniref:DUF1189 domain-containing protein n=1 Tax=Bacillus sp. 2205SS5-2 TaxID=3109031 RepID=UPI003004D4EF